MIDNSLTDFPPNEDLQALSVAEEELLLRLKKAKEEAIKELTVENHGVSYAGDDISQLRMASTVAIANQMFNKKIGETFTSMSENPAISEEVRAMFGGVGQILESVYEGVYKDNKVGWKGSDNKIHTVEVESVAEALYKTMMTLSGVITKDLT